MLNSIKNIISVLTKKSSNRVDFSIDLIQTKELNYLLPLYKGAPVNFNNLILFKLNNFEKFGILIKENKTHPEHDYAHIFYSIEENETNQYEKENMKRVFVSDKFNVGTLKTYLLLINSKVFEEDHSEKLKDTLISIFNSHSSEKVIFNISNYIPIFIKEKEKVEKYLQAFSQKEENKGFIGFHSEYEKSKNEIAMLNMQTIEHKRLKEIESQIELLNKEKQEIIVKIRKLPEIKNNHEEGFNRLSSNINEIKRLISIGDTNYGGKKWLNVISRFENDESILKLLEDFEITIEELLS